MREIGLNYSQAKKLESVKLDSLKRKFKDKSFTVRF